MNGVAVGVDFGTSNTVAAFPGDATGLPARIVTVDPDGNDQRLFRSVLFSPASDSSQADTTYWFAGGQAIQRYLDDGAGRLLQSVKSFLHSPSFTRTTVRGKGFTIEELVALMLTPLRNRIEKEGEGSIVRAVFGRPAVFHPDPQRDALAEERLRRAVLLAGFPEPTFMIEPIAAALRYEEQLTDDETVLVGDFGAGTSDFTLMRLGPGRGAGSRKQDVLAAGGIRIGGDRFDAAVVEHLLLPRFGAGSSYKTLSSRMTLPPWITRTLLSWHELFLLREPSTLDFLRHARRTTDQPRAMDNLITLVEDNLAYHLYRAVEAAKRELSDQARAQLRFHVGGIEIEESITRPDFDAWTAPLRQALLLKVNEVLSQAGGKVPDTVFLTGGTSYIPAVRADFAHLFGEDKLRGGEGLTAVAAGLGRAAGFSDTSRWERK